MSTDCVRNAAGVACRVTPGATCSTTLAAWWTAAHRFLSWRSDPQPVVSRESDREFHVSIARGSSHPRALQHRPHVLAVSCWKVDPNENTIRDGSENKDTRSMANPLSHSLHSQSYFIPQSIPITHRKGKRVTQWLLRHLILQPNWNACRRFRVDHIDLLEEI
jgi:hypothetical protein